MLAAIAALTTFHFSVASAQDETSKQKNEDTYRLLNLFGDVFERVRATYVEDITDQQLIESAITGMLTSLDPHSSYLNAKNFKDMQVQTRGKFGGLGMEVTMENGLVRVVSPIDDTPAHRSGVQAGDLISHLDGKAVQGLTLSQAVELMRGKVGTDIKLTIRRGRAEPFDVTIVRAVIPIRTVRSRVEGDIGYVRISSFSSPTGNGLKRAMEKINAELGDKMKGLVLDLRNNPGGLLDQAIAVSDAFMDRGEIVSTRTRDKQDHQRFNARKGDLSKGKPIVVLVNGGSASASEIVAGALQDHKRAIVLGTKSFGKGSVQTIIPLGNNGAMRLTTALYYTPSGRSIQKVGIQPDIVVDQARIEPLDPRGLRRREADLRGALNNGNGRNEKSTESANNPSSKGKSKSKSSDQAKQNRRQDFQLQRALDLLRGVSFFNENTWTDKG
ncbi:MAG: S41 family peptidase [Rhodospirillales bacterium]|nr:S41 family peptidase [Rhodospirillales bacterium]